MNHLPVAPIVIPALAAALLLALPGGSLRAQRTLSLGALLVSAACAAALAIAADAGTPLVYALGDWPAPFGIVLVVDRASACMLVLASILALAAAAYATAGWDARGAYFHPLLQIQVMGLNGAFVTGDVFNLFVFFEVLLIASYGLLLHGLGRDRLQAGVHYVIINLLGSALFLIAAAVLYGVTGTLNMAHLAQRLPELAPPQAALARTAGLLLMAVFGIKAAVFPLYLWLPRAYAAASAPAAALFAIMTKVGVYAIARVALIVFGSQDMVEPWLLPAALATIVLGAVGALGADRLGVLFGYLTVNSVGTMLAALALGSAAGVAAALYYLAHSAVVLAALFLLVELIGRRRGARGDALRAGPALLGSPALAIAFLVGAAAIAGMPPFSGFVAKLLVLEAAADAGARAWIWGTVLATSALVIGACARAGTLLFWKQAETSAAPGADETGAGDKLAVVGLFACAVGLVVLAAPVTRYAQDAAHELVSREAYVAAVLASTGARTPHLSAREARP